MLSGGADCKAQKLDLESLKNSFQKVCSEMIDLLKGSSTYEHKTLSEICNNYVTTPWFLEKIKDYDSFKKIITAVILSAEKNRLDMMKPFEDLKKLNNLLEKAMKDSNIGNTCQFKKVVTSSLETVYVNHFLPPSPSTALLSFEVDSTYCPKI